MPKGKKKKTQNHGGLMLSMNFDEAMRRVIRVSPEKPKTWKRKQK